MVEFKDYMTPVIADYATLETVYIKVRYTDVMDVKVLDLSVDPIMSGIYEFWMKKGKYRMDVSMLDGKNPAGNVVIAYNGKRFFVWQREARTLYYFGSEQDQNIFTIENPFLAPLEMFTNDNDGGRGFKLRPSDVKDLQQKMNAVTMYGANITGNEKRISFYSGKNKMKESYMETQFTDLDGRKYPSLIRRISYKNEVLRQYGITYQKIPYGGEESYWPKSLHMLDYYDDSKLGVDRKAEIEIIDFKREIDDSHFEIDFRLVDKVYDNDKGTWITTR
jgi:hypothetical protein